MRRDFMIALVKERRNVQVQWRAYWFSTRKWMTVTHVGRDVESFAQAPPTLQ